MPNLLTPEEIQNKVNKYVIEMITYPIESFDELVGTVMLHFGLSYEVASSVTFNALRAQAYKEKIEKLAEPEKLRETIVFNLKLHEARLKDIPSDVNTERLIIKEEHSRNIFVNEIIFLLTPYLEKAKQEERDKFNCELEDILNNSGGDYESHIQELRNRLLKDGK
jgi:hypothetical protein